MAGDQDAVPGDHQVGLDEVGALLDRQPVGGQRVLGTLAARAAVGDDDRRRAVERRVGPGCRCGGKPRGPGQAAAAISSERRVGIDR